MNRELNRVPFGALLLRYRTAAGLTQMQLAERAGLSHEAVAALERGRRRIPRASTVHLLAHALGLDADTRVRLLMAARGMEGQLERGGGAAVGSPSPVAHTAADLRVERGVAARERLFGRAQEFETIDAWLVADGAPLITLTGPAGVGKTRLALEAAARLATNTDRFPGEAVFVDLAPVRDPSLVPSSLARAIGLLDVGTRPVLEYLIEALEGRRLLALLDNFEHVLPAAAFLVQLLTACPGLVLLVTSRVPLQLRCERVLPVAPLPVPDPAEPLPPLDEFAAIPSVALFVERAQARQPDFRLTAQRAPVVASLVAQLDGLPLALELAAVRAAAMPLRAIADRLSDRLRLLRWDAADVPERHRSLEAAVGWSYGLLSAEDQSVFRCLGVFAGRVSLGAAAAVRRGVAGVTGPADQADRLDGESILEGLLSLAEQSLLLPVPPTDVGWPHAEGDEAKDVVAAEPIFGLLETLREYAQGRLAAAGELTAARRAHANHFLAVAARADPLLRGGDQRAWYLRLERDHDNLRAALRWFLGREELAEREAGGRLAAALGWFWAVRGYHAEGRRWLEEALARTPDTDASARTGALLAAGRITMLQGDVPRARTLLAAALAFAEHRQDPVAGAMAHAYLGLGAVLAGETAEGMRRLREARYLWQALGGSHGLGLTHFFTGLAADAEDDAAGAATSYAEALQCFDTAGDGQFAGVVRCYLGVRAWKSGDLPRAVALARTAVETGVALRNGHLLCFAAQATVALVGARADLAGLAALLGAVDARTRASGARFAWDGMPGRREAARLRARIEREGQGAAYRTGRALPVTEVAALALRMLDELAQGLRRPPVSTGTETGKAQPSVRPT
jgi:predicted ATPase/DNA-binding XRE family transcriptional regulator